MEKYYHKCKICGERLTLEMEYDDKICVECAFARVKNNFFSRKEVTA